MTCADRNGNTFEVLNNDEKLLRKLYASKTGRIIISIMVQPFISKLGGFFMSTRLSKLSINSFIKKNNIDLSQYQNQKYKSFDDFFIRLIRPENRPVDLSDDSLIAISDGKLTVLPINKDSVFTVKNTVYSLKDLLRDEQLARQYQDGLFLLFRLTPDNFHHCCYIDNCKTNEPVFLQGFYHTVKPFANDYYPIYKENSRQYMLLNTENFSDVIMMEVGAMMVGRIENHPITPSAHKGQLKSYFRFGGSSVIVLLKKDVAVIDSDILENSARSIETIVCMGEKIGKKR